MIVHIESIEEKIKKYMGEKTCQINNTKCVLNFKSSITAQSRQLYNRAWVLIILEKSTWGFFQGICDLVP